jgi:hypothetical protein
MTDEDRAGLAELWLAEMGAWTPEAQDGVALAPRERRFGLGLPEDERARRHSRRLRAERRA